MKLPALPAIYEQYETFRRLAQDCFSGSLAGRLVLRAGLDADGLADIVAATIADGCSLCIESDAAALREALRAGLCDFVVGPLDEALRILKNELRQGRAVSVGVIANAEPILAESLNRGLQPDLLSLPAGEARNIFIARGAVPLPARNPPASGTAVVEWTIARDFARSMPQIARIAAESLDSRRPDTPMRRHWLESASRHLGRAFAADHCVRMTPAEESAFVATACIRFPDLRITGDGSPL